MSYGHREADIIITCLTDCKECGYEHNLTENYGTPILDLGKYGSAGSNAQGQFFKIKYHIWISFWRILNFEY